MSWYNIHELRKLDPEDIFQGEELRACFLIEIVDFDRGEEGGRESLGHRIA